MNKIHKLAFKTLKKWFGSNDLDKIKRKVCYFCDDADRLSGSFVSSCKVCAAPKILCGKGSNALYNPMSDLYDMSDDYNPKKSIRLMRTSIIFLMLFGRLPAWFVKRVKRHIRELNEKVEEIENYYA